MIFRALVSLGVVFIITTTTFAGVEDKVGISERVYKDLCGVWANQGFDVEKWTLSEFSWGMSKDSNAAVVINLGDEYPNLFTGAMGSVGIKKIYKKVEGYIMRIRLKDGKEYDLDLSVLPDGGIVFHEMKWWKDVYVNGSLLTYYGKDHPYYKIDGPQIRYSTPTIPNLRLRERPWADSTVLRMLNKNERLLILIQGKKEVELEKIRGDQKWVKVQVGDITVDGVKGNWVKVLTEKDEIGWCFDAYLEQMTMER